MSTKVIFTGWPLKSEPELYEGEHEKLQDALDSNDHNVIDWAVGGLCMHCERKVRLGPKQIVNMSLTPDAAICCATCTISMSKRASLRMGHLGG